MDKWLKIKRKDGRQDCIAPFQISEADNPAQELLSCRPDFHGGNYQLLIGLLQTTYPPETEDEWIERYQQPPSPETLKTAFAKIADAFALDNPQGPAFLQDFDLESAEAKPISALLIDAPAGNTLKDNRDLFIKRGGTDKICESCAASALYTFQANAPAGGQGHRVGLRGGGPLTTLLIPQQENASLWQKLWLNVLSQEEFEPGIEAAAADVFPWLAPCRRSDKTGCTTTPEDAHPLQMFWGAPRRIRLDTDNTSPGCCELCGTDSQHLITTFYTKNYGVNYDGPWIHPLTPYCIDPKNKNPPLSLKGQQGGLGYHHWLGLNWLDNENGDHAALVVKAYQNSKVELMHERGEQIDDFARLWCFGYDMDKMKARCWYEHSMPVIYLSNDKREDFVNQAQTLVKAARESISTLRSQVKKAWFSRPKDVKGDFSMISTDFWQATEADFYRLVSDLARQTESSRTMPADIAEQWHRLLWRSAHQVFDRWALSTNAEDSNMRRIISARTGLSKIINANKTIKQLKDDSKG